MHLFLALLDSVSRAHGMGLLSVVRPSVRLSVRLSVCGIDYLCSYCMDYFQILVVASPGPYARTFFSFLKKKNFEFFTNIFRFR